MQNSRLQLKRKLIVFPFVMVIMLAAVNSNAGPNEGYLPPRVLSFPSSYVVQDDNE